MDTHHAIKIPIKSKPLTSKETVKLIDQEIEWCNEHADMVDPTFHAAFVGGLKQAKLIILLGNKAIRESNYGERK